METDFDRAYANGAFIAGAAEYPPRWDAAAQAFRDGLGPRALPGLAYGAHPRQQLDLFLPDQTPVGLLVFIHGGYWLAFGRETFSHLAAGALAHGWAVAMPSYRLASEVGLPAMAQDIRAAVGRAQAHLPGLPLVLTGHSAGGHLAARLALADLAPPGLSRVVPISPLAELAPLMQTVMNAQLRLDPPQCATESPARHTPTCPAHVWVGAQERPAFLWQARTLSEAWGCPWTVAAGRHHFDVIDDLANPTSSLVQTCLGLR